MIVRHFWVGAIEDAWKRRPILWLPGVRRVGKTTVCRSLGDVDYYDCGLPRVRRAMAEPAGFLGEHRGRRILLVFYAVKEHNQVFDRCCNRFICDLLKEV